MSGNLTLEGKNAKIAIRMMKKVARFLDTIRVPYILEAGTLLGVIREDRLLPWDNDVDLTISREYEEKLLKNLWRLRLKFLKVRVRYYKKDIKYFKKGELRIIKIKNLNLRRGWRYDVVMDIFIKTRIEDQHVWTEGLNPPVLKSVPAEFLDNRISYKFKGKEFSVPKDNIRCLDCRYGKNWRIPVKKWDYKTNDHSLVETLK